jgi:hypothetical protein
MVLDLVWTLISQARREEVQHHNALVRQNRVMLKNLTYIYLGKSLHLEVMMNRTTA